MKSSKPSFTFRSLKDLKVLLENQPSPLPHASPLTQKKIEVKTDPETDQRLFKEAMSDVKPISRDNCREKSNIISVPDGIPNDRDAEVLDKLSDLVNFGEGFVIAHTPEYIEGTGYRIKPGITRRLHQGGFAMEAHIDLHGLPVEKAKEVFDQFLKETIRTGKRAVLIVHGRGLSSPDEPVLKTKVVEWLTRGPWRKWLLAYASARPCDGGAGATYVLLRKRPYTRRLRKR